MNVRQATTLGLTTSVVVLAIVTVPVLAGQPESVTICHAAGLGGTTQYVTLTLPYPAVYGPAGHFSEPGTPNAGHEQDYEGPCEEPTVQPTPTQELTDEPTVTPTETPIEQPTEGPTTTPTEVPTDPPGEAPETTPTDGPTPAPTDPPPVGTPELPSAGFVSQGEIMNGEPWRLSVPGNVWAGHNQADWPAGQWWLLWEGKEFLFNGQWYTTVEYIVADPTEVELIGRAVDFDLMLITCRGYDPVSNAWAERLVIFAGLSQ